MGLCRGGQSSLPDAGHRGSQGLGKHFMADPRQQLIRCFFEVHVCTPLDNASGMSYVQHTKSRCPMNCEDASTNEAEAFFALFKRGITGSFHSVGKEHLYRYCAEFSYRWNERKVTDAERTVKTIALSNAGRLMYKEPVRKRA